MLTESEKSWLKARKLWQAKHHLYYRNEYYVWSGYLYAKDEINDLREAAEFEARVAARLAKAYAAYVKNRICIDFETGMHCPGFYTCAKKRPHPSCDFAVLKGVRLEVEEEMDNANSSIQSGS